MRGERGRRRFPRCGERPRDLAAARARASRAAGNPALRSALLRLNFARQKGGTAWRVPAQHAGLGATLLGI